MNDMKHDDMTIIYTYIFKIVIPFKHKKILFVKMAIVSRRHATPNHASTKLNRNSVRFVLN